MTRLIGLALAWTLVGGGAWPSPQTVPPMATARVIVEAKPGEFIRSLTVDDFEVLVDGTVARVESADSADVPNSLLLLLDSSESATWGTGSGGMAGGALAPMVGHDSLRTRSAINASLVAHLPPGDRLRIGSFSGRQLLLSEHYTAGPQDQRADFKAVSEATKGNKFDLNEPSPIWDMVIAGAKLLSSEPEPRALILVSDGEALGNRYGLADAAREAAIRHVTVHTLSQSPDQHLDAPNGDIVMRPLAEQTGGLFRTDENGVFTIEIEKFFKHFITAMHSSYTLRFEVPATPGPHELSVSVKKPGLQVHAPAWAVATAN